MNAVKKLSRQLAKAPKLDHPLAKPTRSQLKRKFCQFGRTVSVLDMRPDIERERAKRLRQCERYEARHGTNGKRSVFA